MSEQAKNLSALIEDTRRRDDNYLPFLAGLQACRSGYTEEGGTHRYKALTHYEMAVFDEAPEVYTDPIAAFDGGGFVDERITVDVEFFTGRALSEAARVRDQIQASLLPEQAEISGAVEAANE